MPKRPKSPEAADDARYFTVYKPYPLNPNWAEEEDQKACAVWIAECIGPHHLWAIHEKPKSRNMMLLEVSKDFEDHASLLGEHRWSEFLKDPADDEKDRTTQVFHSHYARGRDAQKDGWKVIVVQSKWFEDWAPGKDRIKHPYPNTHWCSTPVEDKTNKPLCRPLPAETKPPPPRAQSTVVGSSTWVAKQTEPAPTKAALASAWSGGNAQMAQVTEQAPTASSSSSPSIHPRSPISSGASTPVSPGPKGKVAWGRAVPLQKFVSDAVRANSKKTGWTAVQPAASPGAKSPLAEEAPKGPVNAWAKPLKVPASQRSKPAPAPAPKIDSQWGSTEMDYRAWQVDATPKDDGTRNASTPDPPSTSTWGAPPASPRKGRTQERKEPRDHPASSSRKDHGSDHHNGSLRRESTCRAPSSRDKRDESSSRARSDCNKRDGSSSKARFDRDRRDESSSSAHSDRDRHDVVDFITPQREKRCGWDVPSPEQSYKHTPKPWDKKKKEKETIETMMFGPAGEWDAAPVSRTPDVKAANGSSGALPSSRAPEVKVEEQDWGLSPLKAPDVKLENEVPDMKPEDWKKWGSSPDTDAQTSARDDKGSERSPRKAKSKKTDDRYSQRRPEPPLVRMEDLEPGRSKGQWDHSGYTEVQPPTGSQKKFDNDRGRGRGKPRGRGLGRGAGPRKTGFGRAPADKDMEVDKSEKPFKEWGPARSKQPKESSPDIPWGEWAADPLSKPKEATPPADTALSEGDLAPRQPTEDRALAQETAWGEWGAAPSNTPNPKGDAVAPETGKWDSTPPATDSEKPDDFNDWGHAPHKTKVAAAKKREVSQKDPGLDDGIGTDKGAANSPGEAEIEKKNEETEVGKLDAWLESSESDSQDVKMASPPRPVAADATGDWGLWSVSQVPQDEIWKKPPKKSKAFYDAPVVAVGPSNQHAPKGSDAKSKGKAKEIVQDDFSSEPEDWGMDPVPEQPPANTSETMIPTSDNDNGNWGALQGGSSENWGLPADPFPSTTDNLEEADFHTWEENTSAVRSARDPPNASASELSKKFLKSLKCPTHNYHCDKNICKDMARLVKEEESKLRNGVTDSDGKGFPRDHNTHDYRKTPWRPTGSKRGPRPKREAQKTGQLRGFSDDDMDGEAKPKVRYLTVESLKRKPRKEKPEGGNERGANEASTADASNSWGAPLGSRVEEWGVQTSLDAWT